MSERAGAPFALGHDFEPTSFARGGQARRRAGGTVATCLCVKFVSWAFNAVQILSFGSYLSHGGDPTPGVGRCRAHALMDGAQALRVDRGETWPEPLRSGGTGPVPSQGRLRRSLCPRGRARRSLCPRGRTLEVGRDRVHAYSRSVEAGLVPLGSGRMESAPSGSADPGTRALEVGRAGSHALRGRPGPSCYSLTPGRAKVSGSRPVRVGHPDIYTRQ